MKTEKNYLILAVVIGFLCISVLGETVPPPHEARPLLIGQANPALTGIKWLGLRILISEAEAKEAKKDGLIWKEFRSKVESKLKEEGIEIGTPFYDDHGFGPPIEIKVDIDMVKLDDSQKYVFRVQTLLARMVDLPKHRFHIKADVWKAEPTMQVVSIKNMPAKVTNVVLEQVQAFITAYFTANPKTKQSGDTSDINAVTTKVTKPAIMEVVAEYKYVASKNSEVFHKPDCRWAKKISPKNLKRYNNREEAIQAGKRPCRWCKP